MHLEVGQGRCSRETLQKNLHLVLTELEYDIELFQTFCVRCQNVFARPVSVVPDVVGAPFGLRCGAAITTMRLFFERKLLLNKMDVYSAKIYCKLFTPNYRITSSKHTQDNVVWEAISSIRPAPVSLSKKLTSLHSRDGMQMGTGFHTF
uniref:Uncharacterized protein n=1 Tax=Romanomermis culicivorax TaxID=13658 RepID=A0A915JA08_ROMCU